MNQKTVVHRLTKIKQRVVKPSWITYWLKAIYQQQHENLCESVDEIAV